MVEDQSAVSLKRSLNKLYDCANTPESKLMMKANERNFDRKNLLKMSSVSEEEEISNFKSSLQNGIDLNKKSNIITINSINSFTFSKEKKHLENSFESLKEKCNLFLRKRENKIKKVKTPEKRPISPLIIEQITSEPIIDETTIFNIEEMKCLEQFDNSNQTVIENAAIEHSNPSVQDSSILNNIPSSAGLKKKVSCNCKKTRCLKLYCDCFAAGEYCKDCNCKDCANLVENEEERQISVQILREKNPTAFKPKLDTKAEIAVKNIINF